MRNQFIGAGLIVALLTASVVWAEIDLSDFDEDLMKTMDDTNKTLEPDIAGKNAQAAIEGIEIIQQGLQWTEEYFASKGNAEDGVKLAQEGKQHAMQALAAVNAGDFEKAAAAARDLTKNCKACHEIYKPKGL
ncbi:MAG: hypothetical protein ABW049_14465 [Spongiibacteraceae bacterium]